MTKKNFMQLLMVMLGGLLFSVGLCMCLIPEWNLFKPGVVVTALGALVLCVLALLRWIQAGKPVARVNWQKVGKAAYCVVSVLVLGVGMSMIMAFEGMMIPGMIVGVVGIVLLLGIIPVVKGLKE